MVNQEPKTKTIWFGVYTADKASSTVTEISPTIEKLEALVNTKLEYPVEIKFKVTGAYQEGIDQIVDGDIHFSRLGPASFIHAMNSNSELNLLVMESKKGERVFNGIIAIHKDSEISTIAELKGGSFAFGNSLSTIGRYLSQAKLLEAGLTSKDFSSFEYLGRHDKVGMAVAAKEFTAGALKESTFKKLVAAGEPIKELTRFDNVTKPWVSHPSLDKELTLVIKESLLEIQTCSVSKDGFLSSMVDYYKPIQQAMEKAEGF